MISWIIVILVILVGDYAIKKYNSNNQIRYDKNQMKKNADNYADMLNHETVPNEEKVSIDLSKSPFLMTNSLLTKAEMNFYNILKICIDDNKIICPKVRMLDVLWTKTYHVDNKIAYLNKVNRKHFDFIIADKETLKPLIAIELDDKSHEEDERKERDEFVDKLFLNLKFPVLHIKVGYTYDAESIRKQIDLLIGKIDAEIENI